MVVRPCRHTSPSCNGHDAVTSRCYFRARLRCFFPLARVSRVTFRCPMRMSSNGNDKIDLGGKCAHKFYGALQCSTEVLKSGRRVTFNESYAWKFFFYYRTQHACVVNRYFCKKREIGLQFEWLEFEILDFIPRYWNFPNMQAAFFHVTWWKSSLE